MLTDQADWNAPTWSMHAHSLVALADTLRELAQLARGPLVLQALWIGDPVVRERQTTVSELLDLVKRGAIEIKTRYVAS